jgi:transcriptional regulator with XRE-family HTH domain
MNPILHVRKVRLGLSQAEFGAIAGVSQGTVSKWESGGGSPSRDELARVRNFAIEKGVAWDDSWFFDAPAEARP